jgi:hypothetical protein
MSQIRTSRVTILDAELCLKLGPQDCTTKRQCKFVDKYFTTLELDLGAFNKSVVRVSLNDCAIMNWGALLQMCNQSIQHQ